VKLHASLRVIRGFLHSSLRVFAPLREAGDGPQGGDSREGEDPEGPRKRRVDEAAGERRGLFYADQAS